MNFYTECEKLKEVVSSQKIIIARLEREITIKSKTIDYLTHQIMSKESNVVVDLLTFD